VVQRNHARLLLMTDRPAEALQLARAALAVPDFDSPKQLATVADAKRQAAPAHRNSLPHGKRPSVCEVESLRN
jgi:hypothetical protein